MLLPVDVVVDRVNKLLKGWGAFYSVGYPSRVFRKVNHYVLKRMARVSTLQVGKKGSHGIRNTPGADLAFANFAPEVY